MFGSGATTLIISNEEIYDIRKIVTSLEASGLLIKSVSENETKEQKEWFLIMVLGALDDTLLGNLLTGKSRIRADECRIRAGHDF